MEEEKRQQHQPPHAVCISSPAQGHVNPMMKIARLLHSKGFFITFVNTEFSARRISSSGGGVAAGDDSSFSSDGFIGDGFRFVTISDGLPPTSAEIMDDFEGFCRSVLKNCRAPFLELLRRIRGESHPPVTCVVGDVFMSFVLEVADEARVPAVLFCPTAASSFMAFLHYREIVRRGLSPLKDQSQLTNGHLDTPIDWIPGLKKMQLKHLGSYLQTTDPNDFFLNFLSDAVHAAINAPALLFNTFQGLEDEVLKALVSLDRSPRIYTIGPLSLQSPPLLGLSSAKVSMWKEDTNCLQWLDQQEAASVVYANFGSTTVSSSHQLRQFAWALRKSGHPYLWVVRPHSVLDGGDDFLQEFMEGMGGRGMVIEWCPQEEVLAHPSIALFITHCGWNSTLESLSFGVPMLCWPFFADQQINCFQACAVWGVGMEIARDTDEDEIAAHIRKFMQGEKERKMKSSALEWRRSAEAAVRSGGSSHANVELLVHDLLQLKHEEVK